jgi:hypothetical protein
MRAISYRKELYSLHTTYWKRRAWNKSKQHMYICSDIFAWSVVVVTSFFIRPTESNTERDKVQKHHTSKNIAKPLVISLKNHSNFWLHQSIKLIRSTTRDFTFSIQSYFIIHEFNHVNMDRHKLLLRGLSLYITHINTT